MSNPPIDDIMHIYNENLYVEAENKAHYQIESGLFEKKALAVCLKNDTNEANMTLLSKMLAACKLSANDYYIISVENEEQLLLTLNELNPETAIIFGMNIHSPVFQVNKPPYRPFRFNQIKFLLSESLSTISVNTTSKRALWEDGLKVLFNIA
jgi:DNA polymerase III psi subunit